MSRTLNGGTGGGADGAEGGNSGWVGATDGDYALSKAFTGL